MSGSENAAIAGAVFSFATILAGGLLWLCKYRLAHRDLNSRVAGYVASSDEEPPLMLLEAIAVAAAAASRRNSVPSVLLQPGGPPQIPRNEVAQALAITPALAPAPSSAEQGLSEEDIAKIKRAWSEWRRRKNSEPDPRRMPREPDIRAIRVPNRLGHARSPSTSGLPPTPVPPNSPADSPA